MAERKPWSVKGIDTRARAAALEAARAEGVTLGDYINKLLLETSLDDGMEEPALFRRETREPNPMQNHIQATSNPAQLPDIERAPTTNLHKNLDWLTSKIEAVEGRSTLAITGIDKSLMGLIARIESVESGQNETSDHVATVLEDVKHTQAALAQQIKGLESDDSSKRNLEVIRSLEHALGKLAAEMYNRHETLERARVGVDERLSAMDTRNADFMGKMRESEQRVSSEFDSYTNALEERLTRNLEDQTTSLDANETRQRQALSEAESRQRSHLSELEERVEEKLSTAVKVSNNYVETHTKERLKNLQKDLTHKLGHAVQAQSEALTEFETRQEDVFAKERKAIAQTEGRLKKLEDVTTEQFDGLKATTVKTISTFAGSLKSVQNTIQNLEKAQTNDRETLVDTSARLNTLTDDAQKNFVSIQDRINDASKRFASIDESFKTQGLAIDDAFKAQGLAIDETMVAVGGVADKVGGLTKRAEHAEASTDAALQSLSDNLARLESSMVARDKSSQNLFESFAQQLKTHVENNRADLVRQLSTAISRTEALEKRLNSDKPASAENVADMRSKFDDLKKRVTSGEINQAATLSTIGREIDAFTQKFDGRLSAAEAGLSENADKSTDSLRHELVDFSKLIQDRLSHVEKGLQTHAGQGQDDVQKLFQQVQSLEDGFAQRLHETDQRGQRAIEHIGQQVASASARAQQRQDEAMGQFEGRIGAIEQRTEDRLSSALTNISERLEQIQTQTAATTSPLQKSISDLSARVDSIEDFKSPSHAKGAPPVQAVATGAPNPNMGHAGFGQNLASPMGTAGMPTPQPPQGFGPPNSSGMDLRQNFAPSGGPAGHRPQQAAPMMQGPANPVNHSSEPKPKSALRKYMPVAFVGVVGLAGASFLLRGKAPATDLSASQTNTGLASNTTRDNSQAYAQNTASANNDSMMEAYEIQINAAQVDPRQVQTLAGVDNTAPVEYTPPKAFSAIGTLTPLVYTKPISAEQAAASGDANAQLIVARKRAERGDAIGAADMLKLSSSQGQGMAHYLLSQMYDMGRGVDKNPQEAFAYSRKAAQAGNIKAMHDYGAYLHEGKFVGRNDKEAAVWFEKAAERGVVDSQFNLGLMYMEGIGVAKNVETALFWLSHAQTSGDGDAAEIIGAIKSRMDPASIARVNEKISSWKKTKSTGVANGRLGTEPWNTDAKKTIKELQKALNIMGYDAGTPDGAIGPKTARAIRSFERDNGMGETGRLNQGLVHTINAKIRDAGL